MEDKIKGYMNGIIYHASTLFGMNVNCPGLMLFGFLKQNDTENELQTLLILCGDGQCLIIQKIFLNL